MYEHKNELLLPRSEFLIRILFHALFAFGIVLISLAIGVLGYHFLAGFSWIDALLDSAMLLGGMGPIHPLDTVAGKLFASFYALFAGLIFLVIVGVMLAPLFHRFLHRFHLELAPEEESPSRGGINQTPADDRFS